MQSSNNKPLANNTRMNQLRLLSLDAGGSRSLSQLVILRTIMHLIRDKEYPGELERKMLPCECFDIIAGSDTGGILAIMFTKLRMSVEEAWEEFNTIYQMVYKTSRSKDQRTARLRESIERLLEKKGFPANLRLRNDKRHTENFCRCFVTATTVCNTQGKFRLRTYHTRFEPSQDVTVVEAVLATCATQPEFLPVLVGQGISRKEMIGSASETPNPASELDHEAGELYSRYIQGSILLSLGTGHPGAISVLSSGGIQSSGESDVQQIARQLRGRVHYFRFTVAQGLQHIHESKLNDSEWIITQTETYLNESETQERLRGCIEIIHQTQHPTPIEKPNSEAAIDLLVDSHRVRSVKVGVCAIIGILFSWMIWNFLYGYLLRPEPIGQTPVLGQSPQLSRFHVQRESFSRMEEQLLNSSRSERVTFVIYGLPGSGKTQMATYFIEKYRSRFSHVIFTDASSKDTFETRLLDAIQTIPGYEKATLEAARHLLSSGIFNWLLIVDNADDPRLCITDLLPRGQHGTVVITTRNPFHRIHAFPTSAHMEVGPMNDDEAFQTLTLAANSTLPLSPIEEKDARELLSELGNLALAIVQAGSYCSAVLSSPSQNHPSHSFGLYLSKLRLNSATLMDSTLAPFVNPSERLVYATFRLSYDAISVPAQRLLHLLSFFERTSISLSVLQTAAQKHFSDAVAYADRHVKHKKLVHELESFMTRNGEWDEVTMDQIIGQLEKFSLVFKTIGQTFNTLHFHPLIHRWAGDDLSTEEFSDYRDMAIHLLGSTAGHGNLTIQHLALPHLIAMKTRNLLSSMEINDLMAIGLLFRNYGYYTWAQELVVDASDKMQNLNEEDNAQLMDIFLQLAKIWYFLGMEGEAAVLQERVLFWREKYLGRGHLDTMQAGEALGITYWRLQRYEEAEELMVEVINQRLFVKEEQVCLLKDYAQVGEANSTLLWYIPG